VGKKNRAKGARFSGDPGRGDYAFGVISDKESFGRKKFRTDKRRGKKVGAQIDGIHITSSSFLPEAELLKETI